MPAYQVKFEELPEIKFETLSEAILFLTELSDLFNRHRVKAGWLAAAKMEGSADYLAAVSREGWLDS